jgi:hypothetical protein
MHAESSLSIAFQPDDADRNLYEAMVAETDASLAGKESSSA